MRILTALLAISIGVAALALWFIRGPGPTDFARGAATAVAATDVRDASGVPASLKTASQIERGAYLATAADCIACHTRPGGKDYAGGRAFRMPFGTLYASNITPDERTGIGAYGDQEFIDAVRHGRRRDGARLYPAMPFTSYRLMTDDDVLAIKAFLFSLPPRRERVPDNSLSFPFDQRWTLGIWSALFTGSASFVPDASRSPEWNRGAYLVEALAHCGECHTPRNLAFALDNRRKFSGAITAGWNAYNITPDKGTGIGDWSDAELAAYLSAGHAAGRGTASGPMGEAVDYSLSRLVRDDIGAIIAYLRSVPPIVSTGIPAGTAPASSPSHRDGIQASLRGKQLFAAACVSCHGWDGISPVSSMATLTGARAVNDPVATNVAQIVLFGTGRSTPKGALSMPAFGDSYNDEEIAALANYVTARFGIQGASLKAGDVARLRQLSAD